jgi:hypothetical protein
LVSGSLCFLPSKQGQHRNLWAHAPGRLAEETTADFKSKGARTRRRAAQNRWAINQKRANSKQARALELLRCTAVRPEHPIR